MMAGHKTLHFGPLVLLAITLGGLWLVSAWGYQDAPPEPRQKGSGVSAGSQPSGSEATEATRVQGEAKEGRTSEVRTEIVKRLLQELDKLENVSAEEKEELRRLLRESDKKLQEALKPPKSPAATSSPETPPRPKGAPKSQEPGELARPKSPVIVSLLQLLDKIPENSLSQEHRDEKDALRNALLEADRILAQHLGQSAVDRIKAANRKPPVPKVFNPPRKPAKSAPQQPDSQQKSP